MNKLMRKFVNADRVSFIINSSTFKYSLFFNQANNICDRKNFLKVLCP